ncbi:mitochondrial metalloendopeptidase OMA1 [Verticillium alfalfae VaMs.102]|uniref:Mitochondrial metalloendopeptidase OMA1 n=1 Tax=Verticillium alfalfae (strain VaMs.102 / ATCC MYA-4576 / FGSC 10136) TaxID=526221 RepID=C9S6C2_VERA1|nr:mitochondrial metalloendopeptidase OMA1 [Verticillium alfalfae VaMs.102]EEY14434.1 mitochondrial metalloendopeptidase OMA1 [Verticillium alfalfae VaMs.102]
MCGAPSAARARTRSSSSPCSRRRAFTFRTCRRCLCRGRRRFNCFADETVAELSAQQVRQIELEVERQGGRFLPEWDPRTRLVKRVMARLIPVSGGGVLPRDEHDGAGPQHDTWWGGGQEGDGDKSGGGGGSSKVDWEIRVIDDPNTMNAFVLPGGKVFVHSGILRATRTEAGLAAVLGHEIAHNMASHVGERMSGSIGINILLYSFYAAVNQHRIEKIQSWLPQALEKFQTSDCQGTSAFADAFRRALERGTQFQTIYM